MVTEQEESWRRYAAEKDFDCVGLNFLNTYVIIILYSCVAGYRLDQLLRYTSVRTLFCAHRRYFYLLFK